MSFMSLTFVDGRRNASRRYLWVYEDEMKLNEDEDDLRDALYSISSIHAMRRINQLTQL